MPDVAFLGGAVALLAFVVRALAKDVALRRAGRAEEAATLRGAA